MMSLQRVPTKLRGVLGGVMTAGPVECGSDKKPSEEHAAMQLLLGPFSKPLPSRGHHGHLCVLRYTVHRRIVLQQSTHTGHAFCVGGERRAKNTLPLSSEASPPPPSEGGRGGIASSSPPPPSEASPPPVLLPHLRAALLLHHLCVARPPPPSLPARAPLPYAFRAGSLHLRIEQPRISPGPSTAAAARRPPPPPRQRRRGGILFLSFSSSTRNLVAGRSSDASGGAGAGAASAVSASSAPSFASPVSTPAAASTASTATTSPPPGATSSPATAKFNSTCSSSASDARKLQVEEGRVVLDVPAAAVFARRRGYGRGGHGHALGTGDHAAVYAFTVGDEKFLPPQHEL
ncbi:caskin-1-like [Panicum virgatum]|uniref:caskin-1-like n=1 Tax=Panicum virgatum TaxID=38727 RepID=UPI0019D5EBB1|nr:caskin-1-like [Panicum virgatum]